MVERLARLGYVSIGVVYIIVGWFAAAAALGQGAMKEGKNEAFLFIRDQPFGKFMLGAIALGLIGYTLWRLVAGVTDSDARGDDAKGFGVRAASIIRGLFYGVIAVEVIRILLDRGNAGGSGDATARHWTARMMDESYGPWLIGAVGLGFVGAGAYQLYKAWESKLGKRIHMDGLDPRVRRKAIAISRFGIAARGVVFFMIGASIVVAAVKHNPSDVQGTSGVMRQLAEPFGGALLVVMGVGLIAYGIYAFVNARYRSIQA